MTIFTEEQRADLQEAAWKDAQRARAKKVTDLAKQIYAIIQQEKGGKDWGHAREWEKAERAAGLLTGILKPYTR